MKLTIVPLDLSDAAAFVLQHHRHHRPPQGGKFAVGVADEAETIRGVAIVGRPVARMLDDTWTAEVTRLATDGCPWGTMAGERGQAVARLIRDCGKLTLALHLTKDGHPSHPLYLPASLTPQPWG